MLMILLSFNYTAPPDWVIEKGDLAMMILFLLLLFVPHVWLGALIGGFGAASITYWVTGYAGGDLGGLSQLIETPMWGFFGALIGATISFVSRTVWRLLCKRSPTDSVPPME